MNRCLRVVGVWFGRFTGRLSMANGDDHSGGKGASDGEKDRAETHAPTSAIVIPLSRR
jgi:hypothetical protein